MATQSGQPLTKRLPPGHEPETIRVIYAHLACGTVWLLVGTGYGLLAALKLYWPDALVAEDSPARLWRTIGGLLMVATYASKIGDIFAPMRIEAPNPIPTWAWLLFLVVFVCRTHISAILSGVQDKVINGISYPSPMPPFGAVLSNEEIAAAVNHERSSWGNDAQLVTPEGVASVRN